MQTGQPSRTALKVAAQRAAHQIAEGGAVFRDPFAAAILGPEAERLIEDAIARPKAAPIRVMFAVRSRFAEDCLHEAVARGVTQVVVLGAGLDTFALRNPHADQVKVFEVDHPATQAWKRDCFRNAGIAEPDHLVFTPVDFEREDIGSALERAGFDARQPAFFHWLGVVMYIARASVMDVHRFVASMPDAEIVFDYTEPLENYPEARRTYVEALQKSAADGGEPWITFFSPVEIDRELATLGFQEREDASFIALRAHYLGDELSNDPASRVGGHMVRARRATDSPVAS